MNFSAASFSPRRSRRPMISPIRPRCTPSGLTMIRVRSTSAIAHTSALPRARLARISHHHAARELPARREDSTTRPAHLTKYEVRTTKYELCRCHGPALFVLRISNFVLPLSRHRSGRNRNHLPAHRARHRLRECGLGHNNFWDGSALRRYAERDVERAPLAQPGLDPDPPLVLLDDLLADRQPKPGPARLLGEQSPALVKLFENAPLFV